MKKCLDKTRINDLKRKPFTVKVNDVTLSLTFTKYNKNYYAFSAQFPKNGINVGFTNFHKAKKFFTFFYKLMLAKKPYMRSMKQFLEENK